MSTRFIAVPVAVLALAGALLATMSPATAAPRLPDLVVAQVKVKGTVAPGQQVRLTDVTRNKGRRPAKKSVTGYFLSKNATLDRQDVRLGQRKVGRLKPGRKSRGARRVTIPATTEPGRYHLLVCADSRQKVRESNERNNCRVATRRKVRVTATPPANPYVVRPVRVRGTIHSTLAYRSTSIKRDDEATLEIDGTGTLHLMHGEPVTLELTAQGRISITSHDVVGNPDPDGCAYWEADYAGFGWEQLTEPVHLGVTWQSPVGHRDDFQLEVSHMPAHRVNKIRHDCDGTSEEISTTYFPVLGTGNASDRWRTYTTSFDADHSRMEFTLHEPISGTMGDGSTWTDEEHTTGKLTLEPLTK